jgi:hypothetical protein
MMAGDKSIATFRDYFRNAYVRNAGLRIDHLPLSPSLAGRLVRAEVDSAARSWEKASDHAPTSIELADPKKTTHRRPAGPEVIGADPFDLERFVTARSGPCAASRDAIRRRCCRRAG